MKEAFYFSHDYNARNDNKIQKLITKMGYEAYGIYWAIIEELYNNKNQLELDYEVLSFTLRVEEDKLKAIINNYDLFVVKDNHFYSKSAEQRLKEREAKRKQAKINANKRWHPDEEDSDNATPQCEDNATAMQPHSESNAKPMRPHKNGNAIKERKGKDKKEKDKDINLENQIDSEYISDYIDDNLPNVGKMKRPMTLEEADKLVTAYGRDRVIEKLEAMENKKALNKEYVWAYGTCRNWLKREFGDRAKPQANKQEQKYTKTGIPIPKDDNFNEVI